MKKHVIFVSSMLMVVPSMHLLAMGTGGSSDTGGSSQASAGALSVHVDTSILSEGELSRRCQLVHSSFQNIGEITAPETLRGGILQITEILARAPQGKKLKKLKRVEQLMYLRLTTLLGSKASAKDYVFGVMDDISDTEEEPPGVNTTRRSYRRWQQVDAGCQRSLQRHEEFTTSLAEIQRAKEKRAAEIASLRLQLEKAEGEERELGEQGATQTKNLEAVQVAQGLLALKKQAQEVKMSRQKTELTQAMEEARRQIGKLEGELSALTARDAIAKKQEEIRLARQRLDDLGTALAHLNKDLHTIGGTTSLLRTAAWKLGLDDYGDSGSSQQKDE